jgi:hypothetical protein
LKVPIKSPLVVAFDIVALIVYAEGFHKTISSSKSSTMKLTQLFINVAISSSHAISFTFLALAAKSVQPLNVSDVNLTSQLIAFIFKLHNVSGSHCNINCLDNA